MGWLGDADPPQPHPYRGPDKKTLLITGTAVSQRDRDGCAVEALKAVIKREKSSLMQSVSLAGGWDLLSVPETYLEGVLLLARAIVKHHRSLDFAVFTKVSPLLHHGDDKQKLTAMALFTELLSTESTYVTLKQQYILGHLKNWHIDPSPTVRWLGLLGLGNVALHLQKVSDACLYMFQSNSRVSLYPQKDKEYLWHLRD
ncbi:hypothetical protein UY3_03898 [Chelonia mydas]|uniref:Uncharacterized protein n=1 Tax=Chelonia mydas TaxID=8469 RepID=M7C365_CHEMY|nr:hypothetical protein UY3_03898 [Chelonia mydas]